MKGRRAFVIHGWTGRNNQDWFPWILRELGTRGYEAVAPSMPSPDNPKIDDWLRKMKKIVGMLRPTDVLIGHSLGCQAILRYIDQQNEKVDKVILIAGWDVLSKEAFPLPEDFDVVKPLYESPIHYENVRRLANSFVALFSDDDPWVPLEPNRKVYKEKLGANIIIQHNKGHFMKEIGGVTEIPGILKYL